MYFSSNLCISVPCFSFTLFIYRLFHLFLFICFIVTLCNYVPCFTHTLCIYCLFLLHFLHMSLVSAQHFASPVSASLFCICPMFQPHCKHLSPVSATLFAHVIYFSPNFKPLSCISTSSCTCLTFTCHFLRHSFSVIDSPHAPLSPFLPFYPSASFTPSCHQYCASSFHLFSVPLSRVLILEVVKNKTLTEHYVAV